MTEDLSIITLLFSIIMVIGTRGHKTLLFGFIYNWIRQGCKNLYIKLFIHSMGLILIIIGLNLLIGYFLEPLSIIGLFLCFIGLFLFITPFGVEN